MKAITTANGVTYTVTLEPEDVEIEGNVMASGDDEADRAQEKWVRDQLASGNLAAWCTAKVTAEITIGEEVFSGVDYLGCVSYESVHACETAMLSAEYGMCGEAFDSLTRNLEAIAKRGSVARKALLKLKAEAKKGAA